MRYLVLEPPRRLLMHIVVLVLVPLWPITLFAQPFLGPYQSNAYGPGINSDATGRPFTWQPLPGYGRGDLLSSVRPDVFGPGVGMDQYGRPVKATPYSGNADQPEVQQNQSYFGAIAFSPRRGIVGYSYNYPSRGDAERSATNSCGTDCAVVVWFRNACGALAVGAGNRYAANWAATPGEAQNWAMNACNSQTTDCRVTRWACTSR